MSASRLASVVGLALGCFALLLASLVAWTVPYFVWDELAFGEWSRLIADQGGFRFPTVTALTYQRPLFYVLQGELWRFIGYSDHSGRFLALAFAVLLATALMSLARRERSTSVVSGGLVLLVLLNLPDYAKGAVSGMTDVPVAALTAATGALLWLPCRLPRGARSTLIAAAAAATVLTKPSGLFGLAGLALATVIGSREQRAARLRRSVIPLAAGVAVGLSYYVAMARALDMTVLEFLRGPLEGYYTDLAAEKRFGALLDAHWLGPVLRFPLLVSGLFAALRVCGLDHRRSVTVSVPVGGLASLLGPWIATGGEIVFANALTAALGVLVFVLCAAVLWSGRECPAELVPARQRLARALVWAAPPLAVWVVLTPYDTRLASAAWPGLLLLIAASLRAGLDGMVGRRRAFAVTALLVLGLSGALTLRHLASLGSRDWIAIGRLALAGELETEAVRQSIAGNASFGKALELARREVGPTDRVFSSDGRFRFFFPGRANQSYPTGCASLHGHRMFVLLVDPISRDYLERYVGVPAEPSFWESCVSPRLTRLGGGTEHVVFHVEDTPR